MLICADAKDTFHGVKRPGKGVGAQEEEDQHLDVQFNKAILPANIGRHGFHAQNVTLFNFQNYCWQGVQADFPAFLRSMLDGNVSYVVFVNEQARLDRSSYQSCTAPSSQKPNRNN